MAERIIHINETKKSISEVIGIFLNKYRVIFLAGIGGLIVVAVVIGIGDYVITRSHAKGVAVVEEIAYALEKASADQLETAIAQGLLDLAQYTSGKNAAAVRANVLKAELLFRDKKYEDARVAWVAAAEAQKKAYTAPMAWYNAGVCSEELGDTEKALSYYEAAVAFEDFPLKTHGLFSLGRIKDEAGDYSGAAEAYQKLQDTYPEDPWASLAMSRLIALRNEGRIQ